MDIPDIKKVTKLKMLEAIRASGQHASTSMKKDKMYEIYVRALRGEITPSIKAISSGGGIKTIYPESKVFPITMDRDDYISTLKRIDFDFRNFYSPDDIEAMPTIEMRKRLFRVRPDPSDVAESESDSESESESEDDEPETFEKAARRIVTTAKTMEEGKTRNLYFARQLALMPVDQRTRFMALLKAAIPKK